MIRASQNTFSCNPHVTEDKYKGRLQIFKRNGNTNLKELEPNDFVIGMVQNEFIKGIFLGGNDNLQSSYEITDKIEF